MSSHEPVLPARPLVLAPIGALATATTSLIVAVCAANVFDTWADWNRYQIANDYVTGVPGVGIADLVGADNASYTAMVIWLIAYAAAGLLFLIWSWRARRNAEQINMAAHRLRRGWTIGGWFCPIVNFVYPRTILEDIWRTSRPGVPNNRYSVEDLERSVLIRLWWYAMVASALTALWLRTVLRGEFSVLMLREVASVNTLLTLLQFGAAALLIPVVRQVSRWQSIPRTPPA